MLRADGTIGIDVHATGMTILLLKWENIELFSIVLLYRFLQVLKMLMWWMWKIKLKIIDSDSRSFVNINAFIGRHKKGFYVQWIWYCQFTRKLSTERHFVQMYKYNTIYVKKQFCYSKIPSWVRRTICLFLLRKL